MEPNFTEHRIVRDGYRLYAREYAGRDPAIILLHGFPDNLHLHDALVPHLVTGGRRIITFDFLGWGQSDKPDHHRYDHRSLTADLDAVIRHLEPAGVVLVAHDASGPPAIDWALDHAQQIAGLVLLNTYYHAMPALRAPEAIFALSLSFGIGKLFQWLLERGDLFRRLYRYQVGHFMRDQAARDHFVPLLYQQMDGPAASTARKAFYGLNDDVVWTNIEHLRRVPELRQFHRPVRIVFGAGDQYLNEGVAREFHKLLPDSELFLLPEGRHFVQIDEPEQVARHILEMSLAKTTLAEVPKTAAPRQDSDRLRYRIMYLVFGLMNIVLAPIFLVDRWLIFRRVQKIFQADNQRPIAEEPYNPCSLMTPERGGNL
jgi:pimeloyl-ACP methyl ester carboxylesterase